MYLTKEEEKMLSGEYGEAKQWAMEILTKFGDSVGAKKMVPIVSSHISCLSLKIPGENEFIDEVLSRNGRVEIFSTSQCISVDLRTWTEMNIDPEVAEKQKKVIMKSIELGIAPTFTCTPYLVGNTPRIGEHVAWCESSAITYANAVLGARTNRECGQSALLAAITGRTPMYGYHLKENRWGDVLIRVRTIIKGEEDFSLLGYLVGREIEIGVPVFEGIKCANSLELRALATSLATTGQIAMFHIIGITPEAQTKEDAFGKQSPREVMDIERSDLDQLESELSSIDVRQVDTVVLGCPHYSIDEIKNIASYLVGRKVKRGKRLLICTSSVMRHLAERAGYADIIRKAGGIIISDTCPVLMVGLRESFGCIGTNSTKMAHYGRLLTKSETFFSDLRNCLEIITER